MKNECGENVSQVDHVLSESSGSDSEIANCESPSPEFQAQVAMACEKTWLHFVETLIFANRFLDEVAQVAGRSMVKSSLGSWVDSPSMMDMLEHPEFDEFERGLVNWVAG